MIYQELTTNYIVDDLLSDDYASWTYNQAVALADYIQEFCEETDWEWDRVAIRCDYSGYANRAEAEADYDLEEGEELEDHTTVIICDDGEIVIYQF